MSEHFELFKAECEKQIARLGLNSWQIEFEQKPIGDNLAEVSFNYEGTVAVIALSDELEEYFDVKINLVRGAKHECLHLLLVPMFKAAQASKLYSDISLGHEEHRVIRVLEKLL